MNRVLIAAATLFLLFLSGCAATHIGAWDEAAYKAHDFGPWRDVHVCVYRDAGVSDQDARDLVESSDWPNIASQYHLHLVTEDKGVIASDSSWHDDLMTQVAHIPLNDECDRVFYFAKHHAWDYVYGTLPFVAGLPLPEVEGEVDDPTMTHGWAWVGSESPINALFFGPTQVVRHELYHLIGGCPDQWWVEHSMNTCYDAIAKLKRIALTDSNFFPSWSNPADSGGDGAVYLSQETVNERLAHWKDPFLP